MATHPLGLGGLGGLPPLDLLDGEVPLPASLLAGTADLLPEQRAWPGGGLAGRALPRGFLG
jgi:hypothetical protein